MSTSYSQGSLTQFNLAVSASAMAAFFLVSGFCWLLYFICNSHKRMIKGPKPARKIRAHSIASGSSVPGDVHGHYYAPRNPNVYMDRRYSCPFPEANGMTAYPEVFGLPSHLSPLDIPVLLGVNDPRDGAPPPYPGHLNEVITVPHSPTKVPLPPPYSG